MAKPKLILWIDLPLIQTEILFYSETNEILRENIKKIFNVDQYETDIKREIITDMYFYAFKFCDNNKFNVEQISVLLSLLKRIHCVNIASSFDNSDEVWQYFTKTLMLHCVYRPPFSLEIFNTDQFKEITEFFVNTYFKHIKMYKYVFTPEILLDLRIDYPDMKVEETTPEPEEVCHEDTGDAIKEETTEDPEEDQTEEKQESDEPESVQLLRKFIRSFLTEEVKKMKTTVDDQLKTVKESIGTKLAKNEVESNNKSRKSAKGGSGKGKRK